MTRVCRATRKIGRRRSDLVVEKALRQVEGEGEEGEECVAQLDGRVAGCGSWNGEHAIESRC